MEACRLLPQIRCGFVDGEDFKLLAAEFSDCRSRLKGGASGWVDKGQTAPTFEEAVFEASIGELVRAETHHGLHLIRVEAERQDLSPSLVQAYCIVILALSWILASAAAAGLHVSHTRVLAYMASEKLVYNKVYLPHYHHIFMDHINKSAVRG